MNIIRSALLLVLLVVSHAWAEEPVYHLGVDGLACPFCAYGIEKQVQKLDGVAQVDTSVKQGRVIVTMKDGKTLDEAQAKQAVEKAGFSLRSFEQAEEETP